MDPKQNNQQNKAQSVGTLNKETGVSTSPDVVKQTTEVSTSPDIEPVVESSEAELKVREDLESLIKQEKVQVPNDPNAGINAAAESTPVNTSPTGIVNLPMTEEEANQELSKNSFHIDEQIGDNAGIYVEDSKPFLAALVRKFFQSLRFFKKRTS